MSRVNLEDSQARRVRHIASRFGATELTLQGTYSVSPESGSFHFLNPGIAARTVRLPTIEAGGGQLYVIVNTGGSLDLNIVTHSGVGVTDVGPTRTAFLFSSDSGWRSATIAASTTPENAEYIVGALSGGLSNERIVQDTASVTWDLTTPGIVRAHTIIGGGTVNTLGTPTVGQLARFTDNDTIEGFNGSTVYQPIDGDLTTISALTGVNTIYYRSGPSAWNPVTIDPSLVFSGGVLASAIGGGNVSSFGVPLDNQIAVWTGPASIEGVDGSTLFQVADTELAAIAGLTMPTPGGGTGSMVYFTAPGTAALATVTTAGRALLDDASAAAQLTTLGGAPLASPAFTGTPTAPTALLSTNTAQIATTAFVKAGSAICQAAYAESTTLSTTTASMAGGGDTIPQITDGVEILTVAIVPKAVSNKLRIRASVSIGASSGAGYWVGLFRDSGANAIAAKTAFVAIGGTEFSVEITAGSTSPTTFRFRIGGFLGGGITLTVNGAGGARQLGGSQRTTLEVLEIQA